MNFVVNFTNPFVLIFIAGTIITFLINHFLEFIDFRARKINGGKLPIELQDIPLAKESFDTNKLKNICQYENAKYFLWIPSSICSLILSLSLILFGFYPFIFDLVCKIAGFPQSILSSFLCFFLFMIFSSIPEEILNFFFNLIKQFQLELISVFYAISINFFLSF